MCGLYKELGDGKHYTDRSVENAEKIKLFMIKAQKHWKYDEPEGNFSGKNGCFAEKRNDSHVEIAWYNLQETFCEMP